MGVSRMFIWGESITGRRTVFAYVLRWEHSDMLQKSMEVSMAKAE